MGKAKVDYAALTAATPPESARRAAVEAVAGYVAEPGLVGLLALWAAPVARSPRRARLTPVASVLPDVFEVAETRLRDFLPTVSSGPEPEAGESLPVERDSLALQRIRA